MIARAVVLVAVHPEGEDGLRQQLLLEHVLEGRRDAVDGDGLVGHAEDAVELGGDEGDAGLLHRLGERLVMDGEVPDAHVVGREEAREGAGAVLDGEGGAVGLVGLALGGVVAAVEEAGDLRPMIGGERGESERGEGPGAGFWVALRLPS